ncbi:uncharacterized protein LOC118425945 [Branchiostoma floridae]|uniref:Uncharacterized protein LOC118425945 n=1 Tax=Branchiostoma floridae TaxID=7739 RepID=C3XUZ5_BRAFL|nr:uncharacterized protein LOC118425945 [Branchiostoma floridae]|eukprot:XP_002611912.1 hypothetical protein BRAFLDRAFT_106508 [Branchiostoma floridae]
MSGEMENLNQYATRKTTVEGFIDTSLFTSNVSVLLSITRSPNGVDTGEEIAEMVLVSICMLLQVALMGIFVYQGSKNIEKLGNKPTEDISTSSTRSESAKRRRAWEIEDEIEKERSEEDRNLDKTNTAATILTAALVLFEIVILGLLSENQA